MNACMSGTRSRSAAIEGRLIKAGLASGKNWVHLPDVQISSRAATHSYSSHGRLLL